MEQVLRLISKVCIVLTLLFVSVVIEEYFAFNRRLKNLYEINPAEDYDKPEYMRPSSDRLHRVMQAYYLSYLYVRTVRPQFLMLQMAELYTMPERLY